MLDLYAVGDLCWFVLLPVPHMPLSGEVLFVQGSKRLIGNDAAGVSLLTARQGLRSCLLASNAISRRDGLPLLDLLKQNNVDTSQVNTEVSTTPITYFLSRVNSDERSGLVEAYPFYRPAIDQLAGSNFVYVDVYEEHIHERIALIEQLSSPNICCLINLSASYLLKKAQLLAHIPFIDTLQMRGSGNIESAYVLGRRVLQTCCAQCAVVTLGDVGTVLVERYHEYFVPAETIQPLRTVGAGASFASGFIYALSQGATRREAVIFASKYAAMFCTLEHNPLEVLKKDE